jgi:hypothetical protein
MGKETKGECPDNTANNDRYKRFGFEHKPIHSPGSHAELCAKQRKNQTIMGFAVIARGVTPILTNWHGSVYLASRLTRNFLHTGAGKSPGDIR